MVRLNIGVLLFLFAASPVVVPIFFNIARAAGNTYYVDNCVTVGLDSNNGTSPSTPWLTINKVNISSFSAGDSILFERTCTWRETLTVPSSGSGTGANVITFGAYGSGASPVINGSDLVTGWTDNGGSVANTWYATLTTQTYAVWLNNTLGTKQASVAALLTPGDWFWDSNKLYVYSTSDPRTAYTSPGVEASTRIAAINLELVNYITLTNLSLVKAGNDSTNSRYQIRIHSSNDTIVDGVSLSDSVTKHIVKFGTTGNLTIRNCTFVRSAMGRSGAAEQSAIRIMGDDDNGTVLMEYNTFENIDSYAGAGHHGHGIYLTNGSLTARYNIFWGNDNFYSGAGVRISSSAGTHAVYGNLFLSRHSDGSAGIRYWGIDVSGTGSHLLYNNVFSGNSYSIATSNEGTTVAVKNNIFYTPSSGGDMIDFFYVYPNDTSLWTSDYNLFYDAAAGNAVQWVWGACIPLTSSAT